MTQNFTIRKASFSDAKNLREISESTFVNTYGEFNTPENMAKHIAEKFSILQIKKELQLIDNQYVIGEIDNEIVAFVKLVKNQNLEELPEKHCVEIERIYVKKEFHGRNFGKKMMDFCENWAAKNHFEILWLGVWEHNPNALKFYEKMGFTIFSSHVFVLGNDVQNDFLMKKEV